MQQQQHLSSDAIYEILTRVSLVTLLRQCRWVCKDWQKLICDTNFQLIHSQKTPIASGYFVQSYHISGSVHINFFPCISDHQYSPQIPYPSLDFIPPAKNIMIQGTSLYGSLLYCVDKSGSTQIPTYYICKPATREWRKIPNPRTRLSRERIGIAVKQSDDHPTVLHYKILRLTTPKGAHGYHCEIFDSNKWAWKRLKDIKLPDYVSLGHGCNVFVNGGLHWVTGDGRIFVFYIDQENWTTIELPHEMANNLRRGKILITHCDGKVGVFYSNKEWMELWILENYCTTNPIWKKKYQNDLRSLSGHNSEFAIPIDMYSTNIALMVNARELIWYNCDNDTYTSTLNFQRDCVGGDLFPFKFKFNYL
ncbi:hypothetical protein BVC80_9063g73 [Macleaya cordata]|uniref:F-box associated beta-propeller type 1 domain-containing protein n=1 Tax=Macleaya cordata TaxID=56857 RepID=A0A200PNC3_MACCD|nr:hypothetical protein BVC80_9063g73 [Macleaya cordata]